MTSPTPAPNHALPPRPARPPVPKIEGTLAGGQAREELVRLGDLKDVALAVGVPDIRGWTVRAAEGRAIGRVDDLLVDTGRMRVRYLAVALDDGRANDDGEGHLLTPVDTARLDHQRREVRLARSVADIADTPHRGAGRAPGDG